jgi:RNA polymerase sigma factor (TIGR02999 family)
MSNNPSSCANWPDDLTVLLNRMQTGDKEAGDRAVGLVYDELHRIASREMRRERDGHTLQTTALIHEAYLRLAGPNRIAIQNREHFFAIASRQMRRILVDHARESAAQRRGGGAIHVDLDGVRIGAPETDADLLLLDDALDELEKLDPRAARIVEFRYFGGYTDEEVAEVLGISFTTVRRDWEFARSWLYDQVNQRSDVSGNTRANS